MDAQGRSNGSLDSMGPIQTPISTALGLMQKMEGVARLLGGVLPSAPAVLRDWKLSSACIIAPNQLQQSAKRVLVELHIPLHGLGGLTSMMQQVDWWHCTQLLQWYE